MRPLDTIGFALMSLGSNKVRTALMLLAMSIGVAAVVLLTGIGNGARLYIVDSGISHGGPAHIRVFDVHGAVLRNGRVFADDFRPGMTDGARCDADGNVWCSMGWADPKEDGVRCYTPSGELIGKIHLPETCANLCFGGKKKNRLFMAASTSVYAVYVETVGALVP